MNYRDMPHKSPEPGVELPAFVVSKYDDGGLLLYSHGGFDIWCVYHAIKLDEGVDRSETAGVDYPLKLDAISVKEMTGTKTDFTGSFIEYAVVDFGFDAPEDVDYMQEIRDLAATYGKDRVWNSFMELYSCIPQQRGVGITRAMTEKVIEIASQYPAAPNLRRTLDCLLCAMIAENNRLKKYGSQFDTKLGKKIKALGVYQAIYETDMTIRQVADFSKGKNWRWISEECRKRGIDTPDM
ncbi:hypothetical protein QUW41_06165 [Slackia piriformis]|nr:hypothetical protein [Slackia piriformis]